MGRLIQAEFLKLWKSFGYKVLLLCAMGAGLIVSYIINMPIMATETSGRLVYLQIISETQTQALLAIIFAAIFICSEFTNRTFGIGIMSGCSRLKLLLSKAIAYIVGLLIIILIYPIVGTFVATITIGFGETTPADWQHLILTTFLFVMGIIAMGSFCFTVAMLIKNVSGTIGVGYGLLLVLIIAGQFSQLSPIMRFAFTYQLERAAQPESLALYYTVISATIMISLIASRIIFEKTELK